MIAIDPMTIEDYDAVLRFWQDVPELKVSPEFDTRERIGAYLARNPGLSMVARDGGRVVGALLCGHDGRRGSLYHVAVAPDSRGRGIARAMVERALAGLKAQGIGTAFLFVRTDNADAAAFWTHVGWQPTTHVGSFFRAF